MESSPKKATPAKANAPAKKRAPSQTSQWLAVPEPVRPGEAGALEAPAGRRWASPLRGLLGPPSLRERRLAAKLRRAQDKIDIQRYELRVLRDRVTELETDSRRRRPDSP
jgi:hypothetical protein